MANGSVVTYHGKRGTRYRLKYRDAQGKQHMETLDRSVDTERKAKARLRAKLVEVDGGYRRPDRVTFRSYAEQWFDEGPTKRGWTPNTIASYKSVRRRIVDYFDATPLEHVRPRDVAEYISEKSETLAPATVNRDVSVLCAIFESAVRSELRGTNPARGAERPPVPDTDWRILIAPEIRSVERAFAEMADGAEGAERDWLLQHRVIFLTAMTTGLRREELLRLRWGNVSLIENVIRVEKSKSKAGRRSVAIPSRLAGELFDHRARSRYQGDDEPVFVHPVKGPASSKVIAGYYIGAFATALGRAGITDRVRPFHDARHASLTHGAANGESEVALMTRAGHANMATTKRYLHLAGVVFRDEAQSLEDRMLGEVSTKPYTKTGASQ